MKKLFYPLALALTAFLFVYSCSTDEDDAPPPAAIVKKYTLAVTAGEGGTVSTLGGTTNRKPQLVDLQLVEVLFLHKTIFGVLYRLLKLRNFSYIRKS